MKMSNLSMKAMERTKKKTSGSRKVRLEGNIPAVVYGPDFGPMSIEVEKNQFMSVSKKISTTSPLTLNITTEDGKEIEKMTYLKKVQRHKVFDYPLNIDFYVPSAGRLMHIDVPIEFTGKPKGIEKGGSIDIHFETISVEAFPKDIPESIKVDISGLDLEDVLKVSDIAFPSGVKPLMHKEEIILSITIQEEEELPEETADEQGQPEVITEKKEKSKD